MSVTEHTRIDEESPLLPRNESTDETPRELRRMTPLPKSQLAAIFTVKLLLPVASTQVMPYLNVMVEELLSRSSPGSGKDDVGYYSGLVSSAYHIAQLLSMYPWARLSDSIGRIPVILLGSTGLALFSTLFGFSQTFTHVLITRFLCGIFSGITGAIHSVVGELSDSTNQSTTFPLYDVVSALGFVVGPLIGGTFADPVSHYPSWFAHYELFKRYPYLLPCLATSTLAVLGSLLAVFVLDETLPTKRSAAKQVDSRSPAPDNQSSDIESAKPLSVRTLLTIPVIRAICLSSFALGFIAAAFNVVFVLVAYTGVGSGGLGLDPRQIGNALSFMGFISIFIKLSMPFFLHRAGAVVALFNFCMRSWPITFLGFPILHAFAVAADIDGANLKSTTGKGVVWLAVGIVLFLSRIGCMGFTIVMILVKDAAPGVSSLGTSNGLVEFAQVLAISISPVIVSSLFAFSITHHVLGGQLWVLFCLVSSFGGIFAAARVGRHRDHSGKSPVTNSGDEE